MSQAIAPPRWAYWAIAVVLIVFGTITGFSIGIPFLCFGLALVVLAPFRHQRQLFIPVLVALVGFFIGFVLVAPLSCTVAGRMVNTQNGGANTESSPSTTCTSGAGIEYPVAATTTLPGGPALSLGSR